MYLLSGRSSKLQLFSVHVVKDNELYSTLIVSDDTEVCNNGERLTVSRLCRFKAVQKALEETRVFCDVGTKHSMFF